MNAVFNQKITPDQRERYIVIVEKIAKLLNISLTKEQLYILLEHTQTTEELALEQYMILVNSYRLLYDLDREERVAELLDIVVLIDKTAYHSHPNNSYIAKFREKKEEILQIFTDAQDYT